LNNDETFCGFMSRVWFVVCNAINSFEIVCSVTASTLSGNDEVAKILLSGIDNSVNPCTDFYKFACGNWQACYIEKEI
jgi:hypothetical protein